MDLSTAEVMALEVLRSKGRDMLVARALADKVQEECSQGIHLAPVHKITTVDRNKIRVVVFFGKEVLRGEVEIDIPAAVRAVHNWLDSGGPLMLVGVDKIELYELP